MHPTYDIESDDESQDEPELEIRVYRCDHTCQQLVVLELVDDERRRAAVCPVCKRELTWLRTDAEISRFTTCLVPTCANYLSTSVGTDQKGRCEGARSDKKVPCRIDTTPLTLADAEMYIYGADTSTYEETDPKPVRRLKAKLADARAFVASSGTHHRSKGGSHTSAAREKHSGAARSKGFVRRYYIAGLKERIDAVRQLPGGAKTYASLLTDAESVIGQVSNK